MLSRLCLLLAGLLILLPLAATEPRCETHSQALATFAGGCFWCMEAPFDELLGVSETIVGYTGGTSRNPTYSLVSQGKTDHLEAVRVVFDPQIISYQELLQVFWRNIDPTSSNRQFVDIGPQYRTAIFYHNPEQKRLADESIRALAASGLFSEPIVTQILPAGTFYRAEEGQQDYYLKHSKFYRFYRFGSGRDQFLDKIWNSGK